MMAMMGGSILMRSMRRIGFSFGVNAVLDCFKRKITSMDSLSASIARASVKDVSPDFVSSKTGMSGRGDQK